MTVQPQDVLSAAARMTFDVGGQDLINVLHFRMVSAFAIPDADAVSDMGEVLEVFYAHMTPRMNNLIQFVDYSVANVTQGLALGSATWPTLTVGGNVDDAMPPQCAGLVLARTTKNRKQGRAFLPGLVDGAAAGSQWLAAALLEMAAYSAEMLLTHIATFADWEYGVFTRPDDGPPIILAAYDAPVSTAVVPVVRTQRRRSTGFGS